jgi:anhydro-N-acetylmuramic acid kinase
MTTVVRIDRSQLGDGRRWFAGVLVSSLGVEVTAATVSVVGRGLDARAEVVESLAADIPKETAALLRSALDSGACAAASIASAQAQLAEIEATLVNGLLAKSGLTSSNVLTVAVHDPGFWAFSQGELTGYLGWCDAARVAELTGLNVLDAFPARDLAQGGLGGPLCALPEWMLLRDRQRSRILLDLGRTTRMTYLPAENTDRAAAKVVSFEVGPGTALLDLLAQRLSGGQHRFDPGGRMAAQGRQLAPLIEQWLLDPCFHGPLPRWHPRGVRPERFLSDALRMAVDSGWSVRDLLCTATHFIAATVSQALRRNLPVDGPVDEIIVTGGGRHNGMLLREIAQLAEIPLLRIEDTPLTCQSLGPAGVALLGMLYLDNVPANAMAITGVETPRILGRLTPGSPQNWQRLLQFYGAGTPLVRPLRCAV